MLAVRLTAFVELEVTLCTTALPGTCDRDVVPGGKVGLVDCSMTEIGSDRTHIVRTRTEAGAKRMRVGVAGIGKMVTGVEPETMQVSLAAPYPGTELYEQAKRSRIPVVDRASKSKAFK